MRDLEFRAWHLGGSGVHTMHDWEQVKYSLKEYLADSKVMQFTGLLDNNGVKIFEGDIVNWNFRDGKIFSAVKWSNHTARFFMCPVDNSFGVHHEMHSKMSIDVAGNIYENPELLTNA